MPTSPDLIITGAAVYTGDSSRTMAEAVALAGDRIVAVGTTEEVLALLQEERNAVRLKPEAGIPDPPAEVGSSAVWLASTWWAIVIASGG